MRYATLQIGSCLCTTRTFLAETLPSYLHSTSLPCQFLRLRINFDKQYINDGGVVVFLCRSVSSKIPSLPRRISRRSYATLLYIPESKKAASKRNDGVRLSEEEEQKVVVDRMRKTMKKSG